MSQWPQGFQEDIRISSWPVDLLLILTGIVVFSLSYLSNDPIDSLSIAGFAIMVIGFSYAAWYLDSRKPLLARWLTVFLTVVVVHLSGIWLGLPASLGLVFIPVALGAVLISMPTASVIAGFETLVTLVLYYRVGGVDITLLVTTLLGIWIIWGLLLAIFKPVMDVTLWVWNFFKSAQDLLEEARSHRAELVQALKDLSDSNQQLIRLNKLAHGLRLIAENARAAKEQFVANISHELRTPLNMIIGYSEMILQSPLMYGRKIPGSLLADITVIQRNAEHLSHLIDDILDLSQIEAGQMALTKEYISFKEVIEFAITAVKPLYKMKGLYLQSEVPEELPMVSCDRTRIREVLLNLLSNAGRFTEKGGVHVRAWQEGDYLLVSVYDTGPGITGEDQKRLFQPFEQLDSSIHKRFGGTGLGLAISKQFIEMHDGKIWVESQLGTGTTFTFRIPVSSPASGVSDFTRWFSPYMSYEQRTHLPKRSKGITHPRFIVLEPNAVLQRLLHRYLSEVEIVSVASMEEVHQELSRSPAQALLINHPSIGGSLEDLVDMQSLDQGMPVIGFYLPGDEEQAANMDVSRILVKPISRAHLIDALNSINVIQGTVLIIDDEPDALQLFGRMLTSTQRKYRVLQARDGQEALNLLQEYTPDVILLDLIMPNMSGFQFLAARSQRAELQNIPVIIISARDPIGHPIVSNKLVVTQKEGFSVRQLLACIQKLTQVLSATAPSGDPVQTKIQIG